MSGGKKRRFDENVVTDDEVMAFLDRNPNQYKAIQLCCYLEKFPSIDYITANNPNELILAVFNHVNRIIITFFKNVRFVDRENEEEISESSIVNDDNFYLLGFQIFPLNGVYNDEFDGAYEKIKSCELYYDRYFEKINELLSKRFNVNFNLTYNAEDGDFRISLMTK